MFGVSAFVGGAGKWLVLSETTRDVTEWHPRWELAPTGGRRGTRWQVTSDTFVVKNVSMPVSFEVDAANARLEAALRNATALARDEPDLSQWGPWFDRATAALQSNAPESLIEKPSAPVLAASAHPLSPRRAVAAAQCAWVFGGMMSWNDFVSRDPAIGTRYAAVTAELYDAVLGATVAGVNTLTVNASATCSAHVRGRRSLPFAQLPTPARAQVGTERVEKREARA